MSRVLSYFLLLGAVLFLVSSIIVGLHYSKIFMVKEVFVECNPLILDQNQLKKILIPLVHTEFFEVDIEKIRSALQELPEVARVEVRRIWSDKIIVRLILNKPVAYWNKKFFLNQYGETFYSPIFSLSNLDLPIFLNDAHAEVEILDYYQQINAIIKTLGIKISQISLDLEHGWCIQLNNGMNLKLGRENIIYKIQHFTKIYSKIFSLSKRTKEVKEIDLRYEHGMAIKWKR